jgi:hypothetical protein
MFAFFTVAVWTRLQGENLPFNHGSLPFLEAWIPLFLCAGVGFFAMRQNVRENATRMVLSEMGVRFDFPSSPSMEIAWVGGSHCLTFHRYQFTDAKQDGPQQGCYARSVPVLMSERELGWLCSQARAAGAVILETQFGRRVGESLVKVIPS